jgi:hypothetical protein
MMLAAALALSALWLACGAYRIKYRGRVDLIAGVKKPEQLATPKALGDWVGNLTFVVSGLWFTAAVLVLIIPHRYVLVLVLAAVALTVGTTLTAMAGARSRAQTKSN